MRSRTRTRTEINKSRWLEVHCGGEEKREKENREEMRIESKLFLIWRPFYFPVCAEWKINKGIFHTSLFLLCPLVSHLYLDLSIFKSGKKVGKEVKGKRCQSSVLIPGFHKITCLRRLFFTSTFFYWPAHNSDYTREDWETGAFHLPAFHLLPSSFWHPNMLLRTESNSK